VTAYQHRTQKSPASYKLADRKRGKIFKVHQGRMRVDIRKKLLQKSGDALEQAAQGGGGVTIPVGVQELWRYST